MCARARSQPRKSWKCIHTFALYNLLCPFSSPQFGTKDCQADYIVVAKSRTPGDNDPWSHDRFCGQDIGNYVKGPIVSKYG